MDIPAVNSFSAVNSSDSTKAAPKENPSEIDFNDFFTLMVAQLQNQTMYDTVDNSQFMSQMAQFSMLSQIKESAQNTKATYAISLIGKNVEIQSMNFDGSTKIIKGKVDKVSFDKGSVGVVVNGANYDAGNILKVTNE